MRTEKIKTPFEVMAAALRGRRLRVIGGKKIPKERAELERLGALLDAEKGGAE